MLTIESSCGRFRSTLHSQGYLGTYEWDIKFKMVVASEQRLRDKIMLFLVEVVIYSLPTGMYFYAIYPALCELSSRPPPTKSWYEQYVGHKWSKFYAMAACVAYIAYHYYVIVQSGKFLPVLLERTRLEKLVRAVVHAVRMGAREKRGKTG